MNCSVLCSQRRRPTSSPTRDLTTVRLHFGPLCRCQTKSESAKPDYNRMRINLRKTAASKEAVTFSLNVTAPGNCFKKEDFKNQFDLCSSIISLFRIGIVSISITRCLTLELCVPAYGQGYAWSPASLTVFVGDTVMWRWEAPAFQKVGYRVFSVSSPSGTTYEGGPFTSGETKTDKGRTLSHIPPITSLDGSVPFQSNSKVDLLLQCCDAVISKRCDTRGM